MKLAAVSLLVGCALATQAHAQAGAAAAAADLRTAIKQINDAASGGSTRPRQLSPKERAELRRQLSQHGRRAH